jgi:hypothetical protein
MNEPLPLAIRPMQWATLPELGNAGPIDESDQACLEEVRALLARHGKLDRFALHLAHRHFLLGPDEILIEHPDPDGRTQHVSVARRGNHPDAVPTTWLFDEGPALHLSNAVYCVCVSTPFSGGGCARHGKSSTPSEIQQRNEAIESRRISEDKARYRRGFPVAGHGEPARRNDRDQGDMER